MPANKQTRILLIEDDEDDYIITKELLLEDEPQKRFEIVWTTSPSEGLNYILDESFDVYLIDLYLGQYNGLDLIAEGIAGGCKKPLILLTGRLLEEAAISPLLGVAFRSGEADGDKTSSSTYLSSIASSA